MWVMSAENCLELSPCNFTLFKLIFRLLTSLKITKLYLFQCILHRMPPELSLSQEYKCIFGYETLEFIFRLHTNFHLNIIVYFLFSTWVEIGSQQHHKNLAISRASSFIYCTFCDGRLHIRMFLFTKVSLNCSSSWTVYKIDPCTVSSNVKV